MQVVQQIVRWTQIKLLDISNVTVLQKHTKATSQPQNIPCTELITMALPPPTIEKQNVVSYMADYLIRKYPIDNCEICCNLLKVEMLPESSSSSQYKLIRFKTYKEKGCLVYLNILFSNFVQHMELLFCALFGGIMHMKDLLQTLCKSVEKEVINLHKCGNVVCLERLHQYVKLYMSVRIHHALKISNIGKTYSHKRNRKMLKLCRE